MAGQERGRRTKQVERRQLVSRARTAGAPSAVTRTHAASEALHSTSRMSSEQSARAPAALVLTAGGASKRTHARRSGAVSGDAPGRATLNASARPCTSLAGVEAHSSCASGGVGGELLTTGASSFAAVVQATAARSNTSPARRPRCIAGAHGGAREEQRRHQRRTQHARQSRRVASVAVASSHRTEP
jgi:hypothetical protein